MFHTTLRSRRCAGDASQQWGCFCCAAAALEDEGFFSEPLATDLNSAESQKKGPNAPMYMFYDSMPTCRRLDMFSMLCGCLKQLDDRDASVSILNKQPKPDEDLLSGLVLQGI
jgi:hypothetical protein